MKFLEKEFTSFLSRALEEAQRDKKKVLIEFGGDWCIWSRRMERVFESEKFDALIAEQFHFFKCFVGRDGECYFPFSEIDVPEFVGVPFFILLDPYANLIAYSETDRFEWLWFYRKKELYELLSDWASKQG